MSIPRIIHVDAEHDDTVPQDADAPHLKREHVAAGGDTNRIGKVMVLVP